MINVRYNRVTFREIILFDINIGRLKLIDGTVQMYTHEGK